MPGMISRKALVWVAVLAASPAFLAILGLLYQFTIYSRVLAEIPRKLGGTTLFITALMGATAAILGTWLLLHPRPDSRGERVLLAVAAIAGALYALPLFAFHWGTKEGFFW